MYDENCARRVLGQKGIGIRCAWDFVVGGEVGR